MKTAALAAFALLLASAPLAAQSPRQIKGLFDEGNAARDRGDSAGAARSWERGLEMARRTGDRVAVANLTRNLGLAYMDLGDYPRAVAVLEEAYRAFGDLRVPKSQATALSSLGQVYTQTGDYDKALAILDRALEIDRRIGDRLGVSICLRSIANVHASRGEYRRTLALYDESSALARALGDDEGLSADFNNLSIAFRHLGEPKKALDYGAKALALDEKSGNPQRVAVAALTLGNFRAEAGDLDQAQALFERALALLRGAGNKDGASDALIDLASVHSRRGDSGKAAALLDEALAVKKELGDRKGEAVCLGSLAEAAADAGDFAAALVRYEQAVAISRSLGDREGLSEGLRGLGDARRRLGDYAASARALEEAVSAARAVEDKSATAQALSATASLYVELGDQDKAVALFEEAAALLAAAQNRSARAVALNNLGVARRARGEPEAARAAFAQALAIDRDLGAPSALEESNLAELLVQGGDYAEAEKEFVRLDAPIQLGRLHLLRGDGRKAKAAFERSQAMGEDSRDPLAMYAERTGLGQAALLLGDPKAARAHFEAAAAMAEDQREGLSDGERTRFFDGDVLGFRRSDAYRGLVAAAAAAGDADEAFVRAEGLKARVLSEAMARARSGDAAGPADALRSEEEALAGRLRGLRKAWDAAFRAGDKDALRRREAGLGAAKKELADFVRRLRAAHPAYAAVRYPQPLRPSEVALEPGETLVEFAAAQGRMYRLTLDGADKSLRVDALPVPLPEIEELVRAYRRGFEAVSSAGDLAALDLAAGKRLYDVLLRDAVAGRARLVVVPDGALGLLPFEALVTALPDKPAFGEGAHGPFPLGARYLADDAEVVYAQSASSLTLLRTLRDSGGGGTKALAVVDPDFGDALAAASRWKTMGAAGTRAKGAGSGAGSAGEAAFPRLEKTRELGTLFRALFADDALVLSGSRADKRTLGSLPLGDVRYAVFGTHGILDSDLPYVREPALVLARGEAPGGAFLTMSEVMGMRLPAEVVALTACQTGVGRAVGGEGVMGMGRAFQYAGARAVLMSLWPVAEDGAVALTTAFFTALRSGAEPRAALKRAREDVRRSGYEHPFYWAAFVLMSR